MKEESVAETFKNEAKKDANEHSAPGTMILVLALLVCFAVYYFANWKALADVWHVR